MVVYKITNNINKKTYIGQTTQKLYYRWNNHIYNMKNTKNNHPLYNAMRKHGVENFTIEEIDGANSITELNYKEWLRIHMHNTIAPNGYNLREGGDASGKMSKEAIRVNSESKKIYYKNNLQHNCKKVINIKNKKIWNSATECWRENNIKISISAFTAKLRGKMGNNTPFRYLGQENTFKKPGMGTIKKIVNIETGETYQGIRECSKHLKISYNVLKNKLNGTTINDTPFRYENEKTICKKKKFYKKNSKKVLDTQTGVFYKDAIECAKINNININTLRKWLNPKNKIESKYTYGQ